MPTSADITLIIPAYNAEAFLGEAIRSALTQTTLPQEIVVVDDGSTDRTAEVARAFGGRVQLLQQANLGVAAARNHGISVARNESLAFLDADDVMPSHRLELQQAIFAGDTQLDCVFGQQVFFSERLCDRRRAELAPQTARPALIPSALFCRAAAFRRFGLFDHRISGPEFIAWFAEAMHQGVSYVVPPQTVVYRRVHANNLSRNIIAHSDEYPKLLKLLLDKRRRAA